MILHLCEVYEINKEEQIEFLIRHGLTITKYINSKHIYCNNSVGYKYNVNFFNFLNRGKLPHLFRGNPFVIENIKQYLILHNSSLELISNEYVDCKQKMKFICKYHKDKGIQEKNLDHVIGHNHGCIYCAYDNLSKRTQIPLERIIERCNELGIKYVDRYSFDGATWIKYICPEHKNKGIQNIAWDHLKTCALKCPYCYGKYKTTEDFVNEMYSINPNIKIISEYNGSEKPIKCQCKICGHIWNPIGRSLKYGQGCPVCKTSKGEKAIYNFLIKHNIKFIKEKTFDQCKNEKALRFDFYLSTNNMCIEYDGEQHFYPVDFASKGKEWAINLYNKNVKRDTLKNQYCKDNNIHLLRIPYWEINNIETILKEKLGIKS